MAKKKTNIEEENKELVAKRDRSEEVVTNCDNLVINEETFSQSDIEKMIITIRGMQVMIDRDLARVYKVTTSQLNQQVKRNIARFPANFRFQLTTEEMNNLKSQFVTSSWGGTRKLPYAFTEPGIAQLSSVLHSDKAIETDEKIDLILDKMEERSPKLLPEKIFQAGCVWDAWTYVSDLVRSAEKEIITDLEKHNRQYAKIRFEQLAHKNHDRFLIIDSKTYFLGSSLKDMAEGFCCVSEMKISPELILKLIREN